MIDISLSALFAGLLILIALSAFFSGSETAMMALNRYRLRHLANQKHKGAMRANVLLERPDRLIGVILLGANFVQILASSLATVIALRLFGEAGIAIAAASMTLVMLVFGEVTPKTLGALHPERIAFPSAYVLRPLLVLLYPLVWLINGLTNSILRSLGIRVEDAEGLPLSREELRTVVQEAEALIPGRHQQMLLSILDLEKMNVEDIMVPRNEIVGIDLADDLATIEDQINACRHTRLLVYRGSIDNVLGILHVRQIPHLYRGERLSPKVLEEGLSEPYYVPLGTPLHSQLANFQRRQQRLGLVVDEYGDIEGLVTLEDILEEIVGKFTTDPQAFSRDIFVEEAGTYLIDGSANIREVNRQLHWQLPSKGAKTLNGLILEAFEGIPETGTSLRIEGYTIEIIQTTGHSVKTARVIPPPSPAELQSAIS
ncbi:MAG TPA: HlyC/CorC family transporter [Gammaproteobacteria bacterium]|nr:HlyC/CorC family transporter [Gammaproteobacteria bacterium]